MPVEIENASSIAEELKIAGEGCARFELLLDDEKATVKCYGRLICGSAPGFSGAVKRLLSHSRLVVVDLADLIYIDSTGLGAIMRLRVCARKGGCELKVLRLGKQLRNVMRLRNALIVFGQAEEHGITIA